MNVRDWIHVEDHCRGLLAALEQGEPGQVYNFGAGSERHNIDIVKQVLAAARQARVAHQVRQGPARPRPALRHRLRRRRRRELGWAPRHRFEEALAATVRWYVDNRAWWERIISGEYLKYYEKQYGARQ